MGNVFFAKIENYTGFGVRVAKRLSSLGVRVSLDGFKVHSLGKIEGEKGLGCLGCVGFKQNISYDQVCHLNNSPKRK